MNSMNCHILFKTPSKLRSLFRQQQIFCKSVKYLRHNLTTLCGCKNSSIPYAINNLTTYNKCFHSKQTSFTDSKRTFSQAIANYQNHNSDKNDFESLRNTDQFDDSIDDESTTHFGYQKVKENEKVNKVYSVFENVASSYDLMNDVMSAGTHRLWKNHFVNQLKVKPGMRVLDMAGGTGDISFKILDSLVPSGSSETRSISDSRIIVSDINQAMLDVGKARAQKLGIEKSFDWVQANAEELPFEDESIDLYTIAFGIRNTTHIDKVLDEAYRVLKVGGRFSCLEFSNVPNPLISNLYDAYSFQVIPVLGQVFAKDWNSYQYLVESIRQFPNKEDFADMIYDAGFTNVMYEDMTFGVVSIHDGFKI